MSTEPQMTDFGFRRVPQADKQARVREVFDSVAGRYDIMNDVMSGGLHRLWKRRMIEALYLAPQSSGRTSPITMLDVAGGTGDIANLALRRAQSQAINLNIKVLDINHEMLKVGQARANNSANSNNISFIHANAEALPIADSSTDIYTIAFGMRNITQRHKALAEARRVLKPGGRFVCLEFSHLPTPFTQKLYDAYSFQIIPAMGKLIAGDDAPYRYLVESIRQFPSAPVYAAALEEAGFARVGYSRLSGGIAALHYGWRL
ncbi:MAG: bifunctional demethylmenaquinone methyltransferase/2-methoxy-6-polyprenyl-1,4-benzoquinol methylase UbiE [Alphaproteobacteria bacterium]|nr:bifunctional demethylmenaquinone methyltransferase/2-methoxy-6-polyprenyl-1,4-benzoquinol methylase UbiE [Alphaproteobacteria bacterium]